MSLAIFDLDNTLLGGDSDHAWGELIVAHQIVDPEAYQAQNDRFFNDYLAGKLDTPGKGIMYMSDLDHVATYIPENVLESAQQTA